MGSSYWSDILEFALSIAGTDSILNSAISEGFAMPRLHFGYSLSVRMREKKR